MNSQPTLFVFDQFLLIFMAKLSKGFKADKFESHSCLKLGCTNFQGLHSNFVDCECFIELNSTDILAPCETNLDDPFDSGNVAVRGYLPLV